MWNQDLGYKGSLNRAERKKIENRQSHMKHISLFDKVTLAKSVLVATGK
jgi:hypothetical protein